VKPEIVAPGIYIPGAAANSPTNPITSASGTSLACPVVAGGIALILQVFPTISLQDLRTAMIETANAGIIKNATRVPGDQYGYGVIQFANIFNTLKKVDSIQTVTDTFGEVVLGPNPVSMTRGYLLYSIKQNFNVPAEISIYNLLGQKVFQKKLYLSSGTISLREMARLGTGVYVIKLDLGQKQVLKKIIIMK
jgi:hypothetical protein